MPPVRKMGNPNWHKGMAKVPGSGAKKDKPPELKPATKMSRELLVRATDLIGQDGKGAGLTLGWLQQVWEKHPLEFIEMWKSALPMQITGPNDGPIQLQHMISSPEDTRTLLEAEGVIIESETMLEIAPPSPPTEEPVPVTNGKGGNGEDHD